LPGNVVLPEVAAVLKFPSDPYDGMRTNCLDLELDGNYLYCALGRAGVGVVDISNWKTPTLCKIVDTPGVVEGIAARTVGTPPRKQMIVSDSRCGVRIYGQ
jgi:hypothetical protein